ncbi:MAG: single-stranded DNA-binding protein, partial [Propionibacteriaceae bacterium]
FGGDPWATGGGSGGGGGGGSRGGQPGGQSGGGDDPWATPQNDEPPF